ncbi:MAG: hypothetical protein QUV20_16045 [Oceanibaculum nanhaiense]|uniref:hypothetical protein n=1 Tax=Oceanibaculum nanhaiense TaxID=1909734 RepID=UPI0025A35364|nr:hypothetical protein [Oceanibaculum nanhaiense]MDM7947839.1 hypothetical protein [Oceanibaculum nanhaiense]
MYVVRSTTGAKPQMLGFIIENRDPDAIRGQLREQLSQFFNVFYKKESEANAAIDKTLSSLSGLIDKAASDSSVDGFDIRLAQVATQYNAGGSSLASILGIGIEAGLSRGGKVSAEDSRVMDVAGAAVPLTKKELSAGFEQARYVRNDSTLGGASNGDERLQKAMDQLRETQDALNRFRKGDTGALKPLLERLMGNSGFNLSA